jgi:hypothetical protein
MTLDGILLKMMMIKTWWLLGLKTLHELIRIQGSTYGSLHYSYNACLLQPHFEGSVSSPLTLPKMGLESPPGLPKIQSSIARVKTPRLEVFFILLERSWSVDVQNGLAWAIWTFSAQVMVEWKAGSQTGSLTPDH